MHKDIRSLVKGFVIDKWWVFIEIMALALIALIILAWTAPPTVFESIIGGILLFTLIALPVSWVILLVNQQRGKCLRSFLLSVAVFVILGSIYGIATMYGPGYDNFGKKHPIPDGLKYNIPLVEDIKTKTPVDSLDTDSFLQVWGELGVYSYDFYYGPLPAGVVFLRCYEATNNIPLSEDELLSSSKVAVDSTSSFSQLVKKHSFTIYEGDFEDYYAARIEVWYRNAKTKEESLLVEKVYRVEGWMR